LREGITMNTFIEKIAGVRLYVRVASLIGLALALIVFALAWVVGLVY
jgi:hypothetical protein